MSQSKYHIVAYCEISNRMIFKNGKKIFENKSAELSDFLLSAYDHLDPKYPKFYKMDNLSKLGWLASEVLLSHSFRHEDFPSEEVGIVLANSHASLDTDLKYFESTKQFASPSLFVYTLPNIVMGEICIRNKFKGENAFFVQEKFDVNFMVRYVTHLLDHDILNVCICGWVDVLQEDYEALLYLIVRGEKPDSPVFSAENIKLLNQKNKN